MLDAERRGGSIALRGLSKSFETGVPVLEALDLRIAPGEFVSVVGKSGCGKSTLLRLIAGLDHPTAGQIRIDGAKPTLPAPGVRIMFQEPRLLPWATVLENVALGAGADRQASATTDDARLALEQVQLETRAQAWPAALSGGQKQRVALARALVSRPRLLLLDEPLGALDALTRLSMQELILRVKVEAGFTAVLVTHDVAEAVTLSDRVVVLDRGEVALDVEIGLPHPRRSDPGRSAELEARILQRILEATEA